MIYLQLMSLLHTLIQTTPNDYLEKEGKRVVWETQWSEYAGKLIPMSHTQTQSHEKEMWSVLNTRSWDGVRKMRHSRDQTQKVKKVLTFFLKRKEKQPTSCCSASHWSKLKDTSWSSSGREPLSNRALKKQSWLDVTPLCTLDLSSQQVVYMVNNEPTIQRTQIHMH